MVKIHSSEITPEHIYAPRLQFFKLGAAGAGAALLAACGDAQATPTSAPLEATGSPSAGAAADELGDPLNSYEQITNYNNYYEFTTDKEGVARLAKDFATSPWSVEVGGL